MIPQVVASERGPAQTVCVAMHMRGSRTTLWYPSREQKLLERSSVEGERPVCEATRGLVVS